MGVGAIKFAILNPQSVVYLSHGCLLHPFNSMDVWLPAKGITRLLGDKSGEEFRTAEGRQR